NNIINGVTPNSRQLGFYSLHPIITPRPINKSIPITRDTDYVIIASWAIWERLSTGQIASILTSSVNPQVAAKTIQDSLQACDYNGNFMRCRYPIVKTGVGFSKCPTCSTSGLHSYGDTTDEAKDQETTLQKIEQRLEKKISEVIAKMEDDTTATAQEASLSPGRKLYERIAAEEKVSSWMFSPNSSLGPPPPDPTSSKQTQLLDELRSKVTLVDEFTSQSPFTVSARVGNVTVTSEERFQTGTESKSYGLPRVKTLVLPDGKILPVRNPSSSTGTENSQSSMSSEGITHNNTPVRFSPTPVTSSDDSLRVIVPKESGMTGPSSSRVLDVAHGNLSDKIHLPLPSEDPRRTCQESKVFSLVTGKGKYCTSSSSLSEATSSKALRDFPLASCHEESENNRSLQSVPYEDHRMPSPKPNNLWADEERDGSPMGQLEPDFEDIHSSYRAWPTASSDSGVYSIQQATRERRTEPLSRSFDYYSHTKVRPYDDVESSSFLDFVAPSRTTTPFLEYASPYRRKMSVIDESPEALQRSSSEERPPSTGPPPLPKYGYTTKGINDDDPPKGDAKLNFRDENWRIQISREVLKASLPLLHFVIQKFLCEKQDADKNI
ncbi:hypothetical protein OSTOST_19439, partial [Ostertagia ostertagi]